MKAVVMEAIQAPMVVREFDDPTFGPRDALVRVEACGVCRSDWHLWQGDLSWVGFQIPMPAVLGHEWAGTVEQVGSEVEHIRPGMRVLTPFHNGCGNCDLCRRGFPNICDNNAAFAGGFAQKATIANADFNAIRMPDNVSFEAGAAMGCRFMTSYHGVADRGAVRGGDWVVVNGCGGIGLSAVQVAAALGAQVVAVDLDEAKLSKARSEGAVETLNASDGDIPERVKEDHRRRRAGLGRRAGHPRDDAELSQLAAQGRRACPDRITSAAEAGEVGLPIDLITMSEIEFRGSLGLPNQNYPAMLNMVASGKLHPETIIGERISLDDVPAVIESMTTFQTMGFTTITDFS